MGGYLAHLDALWLGALLALPVTLGVMAACRLGVRSPATRHALWLVALLAFVAPAIVASTTLPSALRAWSAQISDLLPERPIPTDAPAPVASPISQGAEPSPSTRTPIARPASAGPLLTSAPGAFAAPTNAVAPRLPSSGATPPLDADHTTTDQLTDQLTAQLPVQLPAQIPPQTPSQKSTRPPAKVSPGVALAERFGEQLVPWVEAVRRAIRDLRDVPPLPPLIWLGGAAAFLTLLLARLLLDRRVTRLALPATEPERLALRHAAATIGLRRVPELVFVPTRVSPMVTCAGRKRLVMPRSLWRALDPEARQAVLLHELAHLRRKDHWVHWVSLAVGALYWWHPLVWVIRARLRDEADLCCDAWVTALRPERRRGYAETLLMTTAFLNVPGAQRCAAGLAMASPTKRKLARRITMVMTHTVRPKLSVPGSSLVAGAALLALLVMPGVACPPAEKQAPEAPASVNIDADAPEDSTFERHMHDRDAEREARTHEARARHEALARLEAEAAQVRERLSRLGRTPPAAPRAVEGDVRFPATPSAPLVTTTGEKLALAYHMPSGRLQALSSLMVRSDVPVLVSPEHDRLVVHATRAQHADFGAFARLICPEGVKITDEKGNPVGDAMAFPRPTAPLARSPEAPRRLAYTRATERRAAQAYTRALGQYDSERAMLAGQQRALEAEHRAMMRKSESVYEEAERAYREAERVHEQSERARERADTRREKADRSHEKGEYEKAARYEAEAEALEAKAEDLHRASEDLERSAEDIERKAEEFERMAEELEARGEELEARAEEIEDRLEEIEDEIEQQAEHDEAHEHEHEDAHEHDEDECEHEG